MRTLAFFRMTLLGSLREWKVLSLALLFAPAFVYLMYGYYGAAAPAYRLLVVDRDGSGPPGSEAQALVLAWKTARHPDGSPVFAVEAKADVAAARALVAARDADLAVEIPAGFGAAVRLRRQDQSAPAARLENHADERNVRSSMAMAMSDYLAFAHLAARTRASLPLDVSVSALGAGGPVSDFDLLVPSLLALAVIMVLFTAATALVKEVDKGTMTRLVLSKLRTSELLAAVSVGQVLLGSASLGLAYLAAMSCGYRSSGSLAALLVVGAAGSLGVVAFAVLVSAFLRSMFELLTVGVFPFFVLMFFSECMFPLPKLPVLPLAGHTLYANDILPPTLCVRAFGKVLSFGAGLGDVAFELVVLLALTAGYFVIGSWLFRRRHQRA